jgi:DHA2 family multidrug resistance protein
VNQSHTITLRRTKFAWIENIQQWQTLVVALFGIAVAAGHGSMLAVPQTDIVDAIDTDKYRIHWIIGSYVVGSALGMELTKYCCSRWGTRFAYLLGVVLFTSASTAIGLTSDILLMTPLRLVEGLGNGFIAAGGMILIWQTFPRRREQAMAMYSLAIYLPAAIGSVLGGLLTAWFSWRMIFLINLPLGVLVFSGVWLLDLEPSPSGRGQGEGAPLLGKSRHPRPGPLPRGEGAMPPVKLDVVGIFLAQGTIISISVLLDVGLYWGWTTSREFVCWLGAFIVFASSFIAWSSLSAHPMINLRMLGKRNIALGFGIKIPFSINLYVLFGILPIYMVNLRGYQWWQAALVAVPAVLAMLLFNALGMSVGSQHNRRLRMAVGLAVMIVATWQFTALDMYTSKFWIATVLGVWGCGAGLVFGPALMTIFGGLSTDETMNLSGLFNITRALPAYIATMALSTYWTQATDTQFDTLRQNVRTNRPVVSQTYDDAQTRFVVHGSAHEVAAKQSHALVAGWTHANSQAFALDRVFRNLAWLTVPALVLLAFVRKPGMVSAKSIPQSAVPAT